MFQVNAFDLSIYIYLSGKELTRNSPGNTRPQSSQLAEPLWTDPGLKSGISVLIKKTKARSGNEWSNVLPKSSEARKKPKPTFFYRDLLLFRLTGSWVYLVTFKLCTLNEINDYGHS